MLAFNGDRKCYLNTKTGEKRLYSFREAYRYWVYNCDWAHGENFANVFELKESEVQ